MIWLEALNNAWDELEQTAPVAHQFRSKLISTDMPLDLLAGMRATDDAPCLMLQTTPAPETLFELGGMRLSSVPDTSGTFLVLSLEDSARRDLFATICADVVAASVHASSADALDQFLARLDAWRQFLRDRHDGLSRWETVGLIGELVVLEKLLMINPGCLDTWESPRDGLHDFTCLGHSLEIKSSVGPAASITISKLDQLDLTGIHRLELLHVRMIAAQDGRTLYDLISAIVDRLPGQSARRAFENAMLRRGLLPGDDIARNVPRVQLRGIDCYCVTSGFPRLTRASLPVAITEATYTLDVRALSPFSTDITAALEAFIQGNYS
ncbi:PD-(D/E)XK motif protein [Achromobacter xylosoxidans]|uniref:PD-(D/E)XK motif protein n=1 Tax=Achromobacter insolitus TaxID=217204 RepID=UPI000DD11857|nr:PD-(D/E)XK motif protein [Achromobacter insolitus]AXA74363.1 hypothetical protein CE205_28990 [Achromobacter insolitus]